MLLESGNAKEALTAFEATLKKEPNWLAAGAAGRQFGDRQSAGDYKKVVEIADAADKARTDVAGAQAFLQKQ